MFMLGGRTGAAFLPVRIGAKMPPDPRLSWTRAAARNCTIMTELVWRMTTPSRKRKEGSHAANRSPPDCPQQVRRRREPNALPLLKSDHEKVSESFERYEKGKR